MKIKDGNFNRRCTQISADRKQEGCSQANPSSWTAPAKRSGDGAFEYTEENLGRKMGAEKWSITLIFLPPYFCP